MDHKQLEDYLLSKPASWLDYPFGEGVAVYKVGSKDTGKMFAIIQEGKDPVQMSVKCDPLLAETLREKYETVLPGYHLNKKHWNTVLCTGQVPEDELHSFIDLSYHLVAAGLTQTEQEQIGL
ncbi:MmcQ/YjbR family DNA-binding protein [Candidatus Saccharibacteria bacterium]|nr:MmcQ/YjbR family DNA-binding protein [Candidatus Saccharibacteria bacterium]